MLNSQKTAEYLIDKFTRWPISTFREFMGETQYWEGTVYRLFLGEIQWKKSPVSYKWLCSRSSKLCQDWSRPIKQKENRGRRGTMVWLLHCFAYCTIHIIFPAELRTISQICKLISSSGNSALSQWKIKISYPPIHLGLAGTNIKTPWDKYETIQGQI